MHMLMMDDNINLASSEIDIVYLYTERENLVTFETEQLYMDQIDKIIARYDESVQYGITVNVEIANW